MVLETRISEDGVRYTKHQFREYFDGLVEWHAAAASSSKLGVEPRTRKQVVGACRTTELLQCVRDDNITLARELIGAGVCPKAKTWHKVNDSDATGSRAMINPHGKGIEGTSPLSLALQSKKVEMLALFLSEGDVGANAKLTDEGPPLLVQAIWIEQLDRSSERVRPSMVEILLRHRADPDICDERGASALGTAISERHTFGSDSNDLVRLLLEAAADPEQLTAPDGRYAGGDSHAVVPPLVVASRLGDLDSIRQLLAAGARPMDPRPDRSLLVDALMCIRRGYHERGPTTLPDALSLLIEANANVNESHTWEEGEPESREYGKSRARPLHAVVELASWELDRSPHYERRPSASPSPHMQCLRILLDARADPTLTDGPLTDGARTGALAAQEAISHHDEDVIRILVQHDHLLPLRLSESCHLGELTLLASAVQHSHKPVVWRILKMLLDVLPAAASEEPMPGLTSRAEALGQALWLAAVDCNPGKLMTVQMLLAAGAFVDHMGRNLQTPLMMAAKQKYFSQPTIEALLAAGADVNAVGGGGQTALMLAVSRAYPCDTVRIPTARALLDAGADLHARAWVESPHGGPPRAMSVIDMARDALLCDEFEKLASSDYYKPAWAGCSEYRYLRPARTVEQWVSKWEREVKPYVKMEKAMSLLERGWPLGPMLPATFGRFPAWFRARVFCVMLCLRRATALPNELVVEEILPHLAHLTLWDAPCVRPAPPPVPSEVTNDAEGSSSVTRERTREGSRHHDFQKRRQRERRVRSDLDLI